jgi:hypothetical protein
MFWVVVGVALAGAARAGTYDLVAVHPEVAAQTTSYGNHIATLKPFNCLLYAGYGDYGANTGPIAVRAYDPSLGSFTDSMLTSQTEAIYIYREIAGKLYAPNIDTRGPGAGYAVGAPGAPGSLDSWQDQINVDGVHMFDMNTLNGTDLYLGGTAGNGDGIVYRSSDGGGTWSESHRRPAGVGAANYVDIRIHGLGLYQGKLYADAEQVATYSGGGIYYTSGQKALACMVFDGTSWTDGPVLTKTGYMSHPEEFAGKLVYLTDGLFASPLFAYNGSKAAQVYNAKGKNAGSDYVYDYTIDNGVLYALTSDGQVTTTTDLKTWTFLDHSATGLRDANGVSVARSIGVLDGTLYVGGLHGDLYRYSAPLASSASLASFNAIPEPTAAGVTLIALATSLVWRARRQARAAA